MYELIFTIALICAVQPITAQYWLAGTKDNLLIQRIELNKHIEGARINELYQDDDGFLWIGTDVGLYRFDGRATENYSQQDPDCLLNNTNIIAITKDEHQQLWLGTKDGGIAILDLRTNCYQPVNLHSEMDQALEITSFYNDGDSIMWAGSSAYGLFRIHMNSLESQRILFSSLTTEFSTNRIQNTVYVIKPVERAERQVWLGCLDGIRLFDLDQQTVLQHTQLDHSIQDIVQVENDLFMATWGMGLANWDHENDTILSVEPGEYRVIFDLVKKSDYEIWAIHHSYGKLRYYDIKARQFHEPTFLNYPELNFDEFIYRYDWQTVFGHENDFYFLSGKNTLYALSPKQNLCQYYAYPFTMDVNKIAPNISMIAPGKEGSFYLGIDYVPTFNILDISSHTLRSLPMPIQHTNLWHSLFFIDPINEHQVLTCSHYGLFVFDEQTEQLESFESIFPHAARTMPEQWPYFLDGVVLDDDVVILIDHQRRLFALDLKTQEWTKISGKQGTSENLVELAYQVEGAEANAYVVTDFGLGTISGQDLKWKPVQEYYQFGRRIHRINDILYDSGHLWIAEKRQGLSRMDLISERKDLDIQLPAFLETQQILKIRAGFNDEVWLGMNSGIYRLNSDHQIDMGLTDAVGLDRYAVNYDFGMITPEKMLVSGYDHYGVINITDVESYKESPPRLYLDYLVVGDERVSSFSHDLTDATHTYWIPYRNRNLEIHGSVVDLSGLEEVNISYRILNLDDKWRHLPEIPFQLTVPALSSGKFQVEIKADKPWGPSSDILTIPVQVQTPLHRHWLFWFLLVTIITGVIALFAYQRIRFAVERMKSESKYQTKLSALQLEALQAKMNPHFIFNTLNSIKLLIQKSDTERATKYLYLFSALVRKVLGNLEKKQIGLSEELELISQYLALEALRFSESFEYSMDIRTKKDLEEVQLPPLIMQPFVENALWHGLMHKEGNRVLQIVVDDHPCGVRCQIVDNGVGRNYSQQLKKERIGGKAMGLDLIQSRIDLFNEMKRGEISYQIDDRSGGGTIVEIMILSKEHVEGHHH